MQQLVDDVIVKAYDNNSNSKQATDIKRLLNSGYIMAANNYAVSEDRYDIHRSTRITFIKYTQGITLD